MRSNWLSARRISNQWRWASRLDRRLAEDPVGGVVVERLEAVDGVEVAVDDDVEHRVDRRPRRCVPASWRAFSHRATTRSISSPPPWWTVTSQRVADEHVELDRPQLGALDVELDAVADEEDVVLVVDVLVALVGVEGVLDRRGVQAELVGEPLQVVLGRLVDVDPHQLAVAGRAARRPTSRSSRRRPLARRGTTRVVIEPM